MTDIYADEYEPIVNQHSRIYRIVIPKWDERRSIDNGFVYVEVDNYGIISIQEKCTTWFGEDISQPSVRRDITSWLVEWELAEWKQIGSEDSELFATDRLK